MIEKAEKIIILSGDGTVGSFEEFTGKRTARALKRKITKESCRGDRFVMVFASIGYDTFVELDNDNLRPTGEMRTINFNDIV